MNVADHLMNSLAFFIWYAHQGAVVETITELYVLALLARFFHLVASVIRQLRQKKLEF